MLCTKLIILLGVLHSKILRKKLRSDMTTLNPKCCFVFGILLHLIDALTSVTELGIHGYPELTSLPEDMFP